MSYTRQIKTTIAVHYSGTVSYGPSQNGGTASYSGTAYEDVYVNLYVDTTPFDASTNDCGNKVDLLTTSVAATEAAQVASIRENSRKIGKTLIDGFFKTVRSEISQQINELKNNIDATLLKLQSDSRRCNDMMRQMEVDYNRKCDQYLKIFSDLDHELENRIRNIDQPSFEFRSNADSLNGRMSESDMIPIVSISGGENARLETQLSSTLIKNRAYQALSKVTHFLQVQKYTANTITSSIIDSSNEGKIFLPVCYMEVVDNKGSMRSDLHSSEELSSYKIQIGESLRTHKWSKSSEEDKNAIRRYFNEQVAAITTSDKHSDRVREQIIQLFNN